MSGHLAPEPPFLLQRGGRDAVRGAAAPPRATAGEVRRSVLENGIRVVTERMREVRSLSLGVIVAAGPGDELPGKSGLAHLCEHLMFQGTSSRNALQVARVMDGAGGQLGGFTTRDYTCFFATLLADYSFFALDLFGDLLLNSTYPEARLENERQAILSEVRAAHDTPGERVHALLKSRAWPDHALGRPLTGCAETVARLTREDVIYFVQQHYSPGRIVIAAAGCVEHDDFVASVRDSFWRLLGDAPPPAGVTPVFHGGLTVEPRACAQTYFALGVPAPPFAGDGRYGAYLLSQILGGGLSSRLFRRLREERGLVYDIGSEVHTYRDAGMLVIEGSCAPVDAATVLRRSARELWLLLSGEEPPDGEELLRAKNQLRGRHVIASEDSHTRMSRLATQELYFGHHLDADAVLAAIAEVDAAALSRVGLEMLALGKGLAAAALLGPEIPGDGAALFSRPLAQWEE